MMINLSIMLLDCYVGCTNYTYRVFLNELKGCLRGTEVGTFWKDNVGQMDVLLRGYLQFSVQVQMFNTRPTLFMWIKNSLA